MRTALIIILLQISFNLFAQRIDFRNDSLYINKTYVDGMTGKSMLDSLLKAKGTEKKRKGKYYHEAKEAIDWVSYIYKKEGLIFGKNHFDTTKLSVSIKLYKNSNYSVDQNNMPTKVFKGELYIDQNYINDKKKVDQLQKLSNCTISYKEISFQSRPRIVMCKINYQKRPIDVLFDFETSEMTCVFIH